MVFSSNRAAYRQCGIGELPQGIGTRDVAVSLDVPEE
ncbi:Hypothetical protein SCLAV_3072 [Streptomyces clavuligerus]|uniref:Uncharacterized protein n=1 Tax=Streptomyces clavuligerus TaxID=1901 RepID=E2PXQ3_STRCL|nr:Hypothetical protein SCLAV_3072 [Streptomyces clavuligerus]